MKWIQFKGMTALNITRHGCGGLLSILLLLCSPNLLAEDSANTGSPEVDKILTTISSRATGFGDVRADVTIVQRNANGLEKLLKLKSFTIEDGQYSKSIVVATFPPDLKRIARLTHGTANSTDEMWMFSPNTKRVKHLAPQSNGTYFFGTEFTMEDWDVQQPQSNRKYNLKYLSSEACGEQGDLQTQHCYLVERTPRSKYSSYSRQIVWVDDKLYRMYRIDFYDRTGAFQKTLRFDDYRQYANKYWRPSVLYMVNKQTGGSTRAIWSNYQFGNHFAMTAFDAGNLDRYSLLKEDKSGADDSASLPPEVEGMIKGTKSSLEFIVDKLKSFGN